MKGRTLLIRQNIGWFDTDIKDRNSKGKRRSWCKAWAKKAQRKIRKYNKVNINKIELPGND